jgi:hypothetical protein
VPSGWAEPAEQIVGVEAMHLRLREWLEAAGVAVAPRP